MKLVGQIGKNNLTFSNSFAALPQKPILALKPANSFEQLPPVKAEIIEESGLFSLNHRNSPQNSLVAEKPKVLVIEDSVVQRQSLVLTLNNANYQILQAGNGQEAITQLNEHPEVSLIICDVEMPVMNGFEFLGYCRQDPVFSQIPVIMLTTRSGQKHRQLALALGAKSYHNKPYAERQLLETIAQLLNSSSD